MHPVHFLFSHVAAWPRYSHLTDPAATDITLLYFHKITQYADTVDDTDNLHHDLQGGVNFPEIIWILLIELPPSVFGRNKSGVFTITLLS